MWNFYDFTWPTSIFFAHNDRPQIVTGNQSLDNFSSDQIRTRSWVTSTLPRHHRIHREKLIGLEFPITIITLTQSNEKYVIKWCVVTQALLSHQQNRDKFSTFSPVMCGILSQFFNSWALTIRGVRKRNLAEKY